jgi:hypothetical protein
MKKVYEKPRVIFSEKVEARAVACIKIGTGGSGQNACEEGPIQS